MLTGSNGEIGPFLQDRLNVKQLLPARGQSVLMGHSQLCLQCSAEEDRIYQRPVVMGRGRHQVEDKMQRTVRTRG